MSNATQTAVPSITASQLATLRTLYAASNKCFTLDLYNAYRTVPHPDLRALIANGFWYQLSATQGNLTQLGADAISAAQKATDADMSKREHDVATYHFTGHSDAWTFMRRCDESKLSAGYPQDMTVKVAIKTWMDREVADKLANGAPCKGYEFAAKRA